MNDVLSEARELIRGQRAIDYGPPHTNFKKIAELWSAYLRGRSFEEIGPSGGPEDITPQDVALMMALLKMARLATGQGYSRDSVLDLAGYAGCVEVLQQPEDEFVRELKEPITKAGDDA